MKTLEPEIKPKIVVKPPVSLRVVKNISELRTDEFEPCNPKIVKDKRLFGLTEDTFVVHLKHNEKWNIINLSKISREY